MVSSFHLLSEQTTLLQYPYLGPCVRFISADDNKVNNGLLAVQLVANQALLAHMGKNVTGSKCYLLENLLTDLVKTSLIPL